MKTLYEALSGFNARKETKDTIDGAFLEIAKTVLSGGYFLVNNDTRIYPMDIEFYLYGERENEEPWMTDAKMYHTGPNVPYLPVIGSFYPHESGVDVTFENEKEEYRASFFIRAYRYDDCKKTVASPRFLWEDLFGYGSFFSDGLNIKWIDALKEDEVEIEVDKRRNLKDGENKPDKKLWRFYRVSAKS